MEKQTRMSKYKELREEMKEEVAINRHLNENTVDEDDDFLAFLPKEEKKIDDTLMEPLSYETLNEDNDNVRQALNEAKVNVGKEQYNTRLDILNKIKQDHSEYVPAHEYQKDDFQKGHAVQAEPQRKMSLLEKLAAMSPEEDAEELKKYEEQLTISDFMKEEKKKKGSQEEKPVVEDRYEEEEEQDSKLVTVLNYVIIVFMAIFVILVFFIAKQLFF